MSGSLKYKNAAQGIARTVDVVLQSHKLCLGFNLGSAHDLNVLGTQHMCYPNLSIIGVAVQ
jgi:hypothetical protein